jgi:uncharacterized cofD-like protein
MTRSKQPRIVLFSGGTACRSLNLALSRTGVDLTRVVPSWDSGGSSKAIREKFDILSVGDIRQALMTMAHGEGCAGDVVKICNARLSDGLKADDARAEFDYYSEGRHPLLQRMEPGLRGAILNYLQIFRSRAGKAFDFRNGSIGNFILTGACIAHNNDINTAIFVFRKICGIAGNVWPSSLSNDIELGAELTNGTHVPQQHLVTSLRGEDAEAGIATITLKRSKNDNDVTANDAVIEAISRAELIVFGPGSFYSSILPHLLVKDIVPAVEQNVSAAKVFIGNILQCSETQRCSLAALVDIFGQTWQAQGGVDRLPLTHVIANRQLFPFEKTAGSTPYLSNGPLEQVCDRLKAELVVGEYEDAWQRGRHDGEAVSGALASILQKGTAA